MSHQDVPLPKPVPRLQEPQSQPDIVHVIRMSGGAKLGRRRGGGILGVRGVRGEAVGEGCVGGDVAGGGERGVEFEVGEGWEEGVGGYGWVAPGAAVDVAVCEV